jgi:hypothetical protein
MSLEAQVAASARAWREASRGTNAAAREAAERKLADHLEAWVAELLATNEEWPLRGRWFDGLIFLECSAEENERFNMRGYIWSIHQEQYPFRAAIHLSPNGLAAFEVRFGDGKASSNSHCRNPRDWALLRFEPEWRFQFARSE